MNWKEFFKPTRWSVVIFLFVAVVLIATFLTPELGKEAFSCSQDSDCKATTDSFSCTISVNKNYLTAYNAIVVREGISRQIVEKAISVICRDYGIRKAVCANSICDVKLFERDVTLEDCNEAGNKRLKDTCINDIALITNDSALCEKISTLRDSCYFSLAIKTGDVSLCSKVTPSAVPYCQEDVKLYYKNESAKSGK